MDISIIVPVFNVEKYLYRCLDSLTKQNTFYKFEIIIVNDGSTDNSLKIAQEFALKYDNIIIINQKNKGASVARNEGIKIAKGNYLFFCDSDDWVDECLVSQVLSKCKENDLDMCLFNADVYREKNDKLAKETINPYQKNNLYSGIFTGKEIFTLMHRNNEYSGSDCLYFVKKKLIEQYNIRFYKRIIHEDELFTSEVLYRSGKVMHISKFFYHRYVRENSIMTGSNNKLHYTSLGIVIIHLVKIYFEFDTKHISKEYKKEFLLLIKENLESFFIYLIKLNEKLTLQDKKLFKDCIKLKIDLKIRFNIKYYLYLLKLKMEEYLHIKD